MENPNRKTNGSDREHCRRLWRRVREAINAAYAAQNGHHNDVSRALRDYAENISPGDDLEELLRVEAQAERAHRGWGPDWAKYHRPVSVNHCALVMVLHNIGSGAYLETAPSAADFMTMRPGAATATAIGFYARETLKADAGLVEALAALDYARVVSK